MGSTYLSRELLTLLELPDGGFGGLNAECCIQCFRSQPGGPSLNLLGPQICCRVSLMLKSLPGPLLAAMFLLLLSGQ